MRVPVSLRYLQAVKQAKAVYRLSSPAEPIFVQWVVDPEKAGGCVKGSFVKTCACAPWKGGTQLLAAWEWSLDRLLSSLPGAVWCGEPRLHWLELARYVSWRRIGKARSLFRASSLKTCAESLKV